MRSTLTRECYIPTADKGAEIEVQGEAIVYTWIDNSKILAKGFYGKAAKPAFYHRFGTIERRDAFVAKWFADRKAVEDVIAARKAEKAAAKAALNVVEDLPIGTIMVASGGYEQTNVQFYKVVGHKGRQTALLVEVGSKSVGGEGGASMSDYVAADTDHCGTKVITARQCAKDRVNGGYHGIGKWDGRPQYRSWYA